MKILDFPKVIQSHEYDCGPTAIQSVLLYFGIDIRREILIEEAGTKETGTPILNIEKVLKNYGLDIDSRSMNIEDIKNFLDKEIPVIVLLQAWRIDDTKNWVDDFDDGHYVVAIGYDESKIYFEDPYIPNTVWLSYDEMTERWHDIINGEKYFNHGIAVSGKNKEYSSDSVIHMD